MTEWDVPRQNAQHQRRYHCQDCQRHRVERGPGKKTTEDLLYDSSLTKLDNSLPCPTAMETRVAAAEPKNSRNGNKGILWNHDNVLIITWKPQIAKILSNTHDAPLLYMLYQNHTKYVNPGEIDVC